MDLKAILDSDACPRHTPSSVKGTAHQHFCAKATLSLICKCLTRIFSLLGVQSPATYGLGMFINVKQAGQDVHRVVTVK